VKPVFLEGFGLPLLVTHTLFASLLLFASMRQAILGVRWWRGQAVDVAAVRTWGRASLLGYLACFALGLLLYPHFRVHVRGLVLDRVAPWASNLFDMKEGFATLAFPLALGLFLASRKDGEGARGAFAAQALALAGLVVFACVAGMIVTATKGV
jgi:hypothetical protein